MTTETPLHLPPTKVVAWPKRDLSCASKGVFPRHATGRGIANDQLFRQRVIWASLSFAAFVVAMVLGGGARYM